MKLAFVLPFVAAADVPLTMSWEEWKNEFGMAFNGEEEATRQSVYEANVATIEAENAKGQGYTLGVNQFAHLTEDEFIAQYTCGADGCASDTRSDAHMGELEIGEFADTVDWTTVDGIVNPVKDQGQCGSCWAFSAVGAVESAHALAASELKDLAEQQVVDCSHNGGSQGCNGGFNQYAIEYIGTAGAAKQSDYPYKAADGTCQDSSVAKDLKAGVVTGYSSVTKSNDGLRSAVNTQPVSVTVKAGLSWQLYRKGVLSNQCGVLGRPNHAVIAVGYDADTFKIRNSWGASWGEAGHVRLSTADSDPFCLYKTAPFIPTLSESVSV
jgi:KDEL-tailed cysteine endopeptidase